MVIAFIWFDVLTACNCSTKGMDSCTKIGGICNCAIEYSGIRCTECNDGYYQSAIENGERTCIGNYEWYIFYISISNFSVNNYSFLLACDCGSSSCSKTDGSCNCTIGYSGYDCNNCADGYYMTDLVNGKVNCSGEY